MPKVLIIDDEPQILRFLRPALEASGYQVLHAAAGREALRLIANSAPDMIVLDLGLPDMDGKDVLAEARKFTSAPIVILFFLTQRTFIQGIALTGTKG